MNIVQKIGEDNANRLIMELIDALQNRNADDFVDELKEIYGFNECDV